MSHPRFVKLSTCERPAIWLNIDSIISIVPDKNGGSGSYVKCLDDGDETLGWLVQESAETVLRLIGAEVAS